MMMQRIRDKAQGALAWIIVATIAIAFCLMSVSGNLFRSSSSTSAKVYDREISSYEVDSLYNRWLRYSVNQKGFDANQIDPKYIKQQITKSLAEQQAVVTGLQRSGFSVSDRVLVANIRQDANLQHEGNFSLERYKQYLHQANLTEFDFEQARREDLMMAQVQQGLVASAFALKSEVEQVIKIKNQKRSFGYAIVPMDRYKVMAKIGEQTINDYYTKHPDLFVQPEKIKLEYIELSIDNLLQKVVVSDAKLQEYYKNNMQSFSEPESLHVRHIMIANSADAKAKIDAIYTKLQKGDNFAALAKKESDDKQTAVNGGDLGWMAKGDELPAEVYALAKNNDFTPPVQTAYGWHIFQLVDRKVAKAKDYSAVKKIVESRYKRESAEALFSKQGEELANLAFENPQSLQAASERLLLPVQSTDYFERTANSGLAASKNVLNAAFSEEVLIKRNNSDLIRISDDSFVVVRIKDAQPQRKLTLEEARDQIITHLRNDLAHGLAKDAAIDLQTQIQQGKVPTTVMASKNLTWRSVRNLARDDKSVPRNIMTQAFALSKPEAGQTTLTTNFPLANGDYVVLSLTGVTEQADKTGKSAEDADMQDMLKQQVSILHGRLEYNSVQAALIEQAKIEYNTQ